MSRRRTTTTGAEHGQSRELVVRFAHIDAAGIVFYPRYLEMLAQSFPEVAPVEGPFTLEIAFMKPTPLGTRLTLTLVAAAPQDGWRLSGKAGDEEQFTMTWERGENLPLSPQDHHPNRPAFRSEPMRVENWAAGPGARLQVSRYYEFINTAVEQWFENELELPFSRLHGDRAGIPTVVLQTVCAQLPRLGDDLCVWIRPARIGRSSVQFDSWLVGPRGCVIRTSQTIVFVRLKQDGSRSVSLPPDLREKLLRHLAETAPS